MRTRCFLYAVCSAPPQHYRASALPPPFPSSQCETVSDHFWMDLVSCCASKSPRAVPPHSQAPMQRRCVSYALRMSPACIISLHPKASVRPEECPHFLRRKIPHRGPVSLRGSTVTATLTSTLPTAIPSGIPARGRHPLRGCLVPLPPLARVHHTPHVFLRLCCPISGVYHNRQIEQYA